MPELPEVQTIVTMLAPLLRGASIAQVELRRPDVVHPAGTPLSQLLTGRTVADVQRRAKRIVFSLRGGDWFYIHLGMSGRLEISSTHPPAPHTHLILTCRSSGGEAQVRFRDPRRFGGVWWCGGRSPCDDASLGPDALEINHAALHAQLQRTRSALKSALLDQRLLAGLGNIYADEALHAAALHPCRPANSLGIPETRRLLHAIRSVLRRALRHRGSTLRDYRDASGQAGDFQRLHRVYARAGLPCPACGRPLTRLVVAGRGTHCCEACQPLLP